MSKVKKAWSFLAELSGVVASLGMMYFAFSFLLDKFIGIYSKNLPAGVILIVALFISVLFLFSTLVRSIRKTKEFLGPEKYAASVIQVGGEGSRQTTKEAWYLTEHAFLNPPDEWANVGFNSLGDVMSLSPKDGYKITKCESPTGNQILDEPGYPAGCRILLEEKLKNSILIECEKS